MNSENERKIRAGVVVYLIFFALAVRTWFNAYVHVKKPCQGKQQDNEWDYLMFTQQWPPSSCVQWEEENQNNLCVSDIFFDRWTVHGIWPTRNQTIGPEYCNKTAKFTPIPIRSLIPLLDRDWPNIHENFTESSLWQHEWEKHGACLLDHEKLGGEYDYFSGGLNLAVTHNLTTILSSGGIVSSLIVSYNASQLWDAVQDHYKVKPKMDCVYDKDLDQHLLWQIKLCFSKSLQLIDCPLAHDADGFSSCPLRKPVYYPTKELVMKKREIKFKKSLERKIFWYQIAKIFTVW